MRQVQKSRIHFASSFPTRPMTRSARRTDQPQRPCAESDPQPHRGRRRRSPAAVRDSTPTPSRCRCRAGSCGSRRGVPPPRRSGCRRSATTAPGRRRARPRPAESARRRLAAVARRWRTRARRRPGGAGSSRSRRAARRTRPAARPAARSTAAQRGLGKKPAGHARLVRHDDQLVAGVRAAGAAPRPRRASAGSARGRRCTARPRQACRPCRGRPPAPAAHHAVVVVRHGDRLTASSSPASG